MTDLDKVFAGCDSVLLLLICESVWNKLNADLPFYKFSWTAGQIFSQLMCSWTWSQFLGHLMVSSQQLTDFCNCDPTATAHRFCNCDPISNILWWAKPWINCKVHVSLSESFIPLETCVWHTASLPKKFQTLSVFLSLFFWVWNKTLFACSFMKTKKNTT